jgi:hypothetical protein
VTAAENEGVGYLTRSAIRSYPQWRTAAAVAFMRRGSRGAWER